MNRVTGDPTLFWDGGNSMRILVTLLCSSENSPSPGPHTLPHFPSSSPFLRLWLTWKVDGNSIYGVWEPGLPQCRGQYGVGNYTGKSGVQDLQGWQVGEVSE